MPKPRPTWSRIGSALVCIVLATSQVSPTIALAASSTVDKAETVHVQTNANGEVTKVRVEELLANGDGARQLQDRSDLTSIQPGEDDLTYTSGPDGTLTWQANGDEVSYEGTSAEQPPVTIDVTYTLDGRKLKASELAGASGRLTIRLDYRNNVSAMRTIDGKEQRIYTPFVCMTAAMLDSSVFSNVTATNARVLDDKGGIAVIGFALPGLRESLDIDSEDIDLDLPEYLEVQADVTDLALDPIYTIVTPELFSDIDTSDLDLGDLGEGTSELQDAMGKLVDGSGTLSDALHQLADGAGQMSGGVAEFREAISALPTGMAALAGGASAIADGLAAGSAAASQMSEGASGLSGLAQGTEAAIGGATDALGGAAAKVGEARGSVQSLHDKAVSLDLEATRRGISDAATATADARDAAGTARSLLEATGTGTDETKAAAQEQLSAALATLQELQAQELTEEQRQVVQSALDQLAAADASLAGLSYVVPDEVATQLERLEQAQGTLDASATQIAGSEADLGEVASGAAGALGALDEASGSISAATGSLGTAAGAAASLSQGAGGLAQGLSGLATQLGTVAGGASTMATQMQQLSGQAPQMIGGMDALGSGIGQLVSALDATADGSDQLTSGLSTFNDEGITKVVDALDDLDGDVDSLTGRLEALRDAARAYDTFAGKADGQSGSVRFIYKTEQIG